ncbi:MAG: hypothetical protein AB2A00_20385 [Myxococcota bacterium]
MTATERPLFIAQAKLTQWADEGKVAVNGNVLTLLAEKRSYTLVEAVRFLTVIGGDPDKLGLLGKVRTRDQLKQLKAEHMAGTVLVGDLGYEVQEGFVGAILQPRPAPAPAAPTRPVAPPPPAPPKAAAPPPPPAPVAPPPAVPTPAPSLADALQTATTGDAAAKPAPSDQELLTNFLLANLSG